MRFSGANFRNPRGWGSFHKGGRGGSVRSVATPHLLLVIFVINAYNGFLIININLKESSVRGKR